jgi:hypothetical protein
MINIEEVIQMWDVDSKIDKMNLDDASIKSPALHAKYLQLYSATKMMVKQAEMKMIELKKNKWLWFNGKMTKEQMDALGWAYDPFAGMTKPLKSDLDIFYDSDPDVIKLRAKIDYLATALEVVKEIIDNIKWRHTHIKNAIDFLRFTSGG